MNTMLRSLRPALIAIGILPLIAHANLALAQSQQELVEAFSGDWVVIDAMFNTDGVPCRIALDHAVAPGDALDWKRTEIAPNCAAPLNAQTLWQIDEGKIVLRSSDGTQLAALGGTPTRLTGSYNGTPDTIILERSQGSGAKAALVAAIGRHKCYFLGYSDKCADEAGTHAPEFTDEGAKISVLVSLNVRNQPRRDAPVIGAVPQDSDVSVDLCLAASDGLWCRARFGDQSGWMAKSAIRQQEWPVVTFVNTP